MKLALIGLVLYLTMGSVAQVGHVKLGTVCSISGKIQVRYAGKVVRVLKQKEELWLDELVLVPRGCVLAFTNRAGEKERVPATGTWGRLRVSQPDDVKRAQVILKSALEVAVKPRGSDPFEIPGVGPMPVSLFRVVLAKPGQIVSIELRDGSDLLYSGSYSPTALVAVLAKTRATEPDEFLRLSVKTRRQTIQTRFLLMSEADEAAVVHAFEIADAERDPIARHISRAAQFVTLGWYVSASDELEKASKLAIFPDGALRTETATVAGLRS